MASRLSELSVKKSFDQALNAMPWRNPQASFDLKLTNVDLNALVSADNAKEKIQEVPARDLYLAIKEAGLTEYPQVVSMMSTEQFTRVLDYDTWHEDRLTLDAALPWLQLLPTFGKESLYHRFSDLEEEYQIGLLEGKVRTYDKEEFDQLPPQHQDNLLALPGEQLFYEVLDDNPETEAFVCRLIESAMHENVPYAMSLLAYAQYSVPKESEFQLTQFRKARMEEDGFVAYEDALHSFDPINFVTSKATWKKKFEDMQFADVDATVPAVNTSGAGFLDQVLDSISTQSEQGNDVEGIQQRLMIFTTGLCSVCGVEPGDTKGLKQLLSRTKSTLGIGLEFLSDGSLLKAATLLRDEHPKVLFRVGHTLTGLVQVKVLDLIAIYDQTFSDQGKALLLAQKYGELAWQIDLRLDRFGFELCEVLKGLLSRFPLIPVQRPQDGAEKILFEPIDSLADLDATGTVLETLLKHTFAN